MWDEAEHAFEVWAEGAGVVAVPWGLRRPPLQLFQYLPQSVRWRPDYLCEDTHNVISDIFHIHARKHFFVEVKGVGRDQQVKIKHQSIDMLEKISAFDGLETMIFVYDSHRKQITMCELSFIGGVQWQYPQGVFREGQSYVRLPTELFTWVSVE